MSSHIFDENLLRRSSAINSSLVDGMRRRNYTGERGMRMQLRRKPMLVVVFYGRLIELKSGSRATRNLIATLN